MVITKKFGYSYIIKEKIAGDIFVYIYMFVVCVFFFFFQAEDGIRDYKVTGVQTCALPIWLDVDDVVSQGLASGEGVLNANEVDLGVCLIDIGAGTTDVVVYNEGSALHMEIGRASCRERV